MAAILGLVDSIQGFGFEESFISLFYVFECTSKLQALLDITSYSFMIVSFESIKYNLCNFQYGQGLQGNG